MLIHHQERRIPAIHEKFHVEVAQRMEITAFASSRNEISHLNPVFSAPARALAGQTMGTVGPKAQIDADSGLVLVKYADRAELRF